jgi:hypothetical protein
MTFSEISQLTRNQSCGVSVLSFLLAFCHDAITTRFVSRRNHRCSLKPNGIAALGAPPCAWSKILFPWVHVKVTLLKASSNYKAVRNDWFSFLFSFLTHFAARIILKKILAQLPVMAYPEQMQLMTLPRESWEAWNQSVLHGDDLILDPDRRCGIGSIEVFTSNMPQMSEATVRQQKDEGHESNYGSPSTLHTCTTQKRRTLCK